MTKNEDLKIEAVPTRAILTVRDVLSLEAEIGPDDITALMDILRLPETRKGEWGNLPATLFHDDEDGSAELVVGDADEAQGTFLTILFDAPPEYDWCEFKMVIGQGRMASFWRQAKERLAVGAMADDRIGLVKAVLQFAADEGGSPVIAFNEWLAASDREGGVSLPALPLAA